MLKYRHSEAPFKIIKVCSGTVPVKVMDDQTFLYKQNFSKEKNLKINISKLKCFCRFSMSRETKNMCFSVCSQKYTRMIKYFNFISDLWSDLA
jgi:hypothetical protein